MAVDPVTIKMLDALTSYGRFGKSRPEVALYIVRSWLWDNEARLKNAIANSGRPLGFDMDDAE